ncbi:MAG TPA: sulfotransferase domain-containing protein [Gammaproteobacteria bacterium]
MGVKPRYSMHGDYRMPLGFPPDNFDTALEYAAEPGDIFIASYPKSGTTWVQYMAYLLKSDGRALPPGEMLGDAIPHLEEVGRETAERVPKPRILKTHFTSDMTPAHAEARYVVVVRNPFDCAVSFYHHTRGFVKHYDFAEGTFDDFFECFIVGAVDSGDYFEHLGSWYRRRLDSNVLLLIYEEMKLDPFAAVTALSRFLGLPRDADEKFLAGIVAESSFSRMSGNQERWSSARPADMPAFVRKGVVGDWNNYFTPEQAGRLAKRFDSAAKRYGYGELWPDILEAARRP